MTCCSGRRALDGPGVAGLSARVSKIDDKFYDIVCVIAMTGNYGCYKIPAVLDPSCPSSAPQASQECGVAACTPCNAGGIYFDSSGNQKTGYCVCPELNDGGTRRWSCASATAWPCPLGQGCS